MRCIVYTALCKPTLIYGVPREYLYVCGLLCLVVWNLTQVVFIGMATFPIWFFSGWLWAKVDPDFMSIFIIRSKYIKANFNLSKIKGNEYQA